uniref:Uncharacterized protein n=1 Tax=Octopus bimaculoides TaxID=37653 RepID=A0A0L8GSL2_OCTBM
MHPHPASFHKHLMYYLFFKYSFKIFLVESQDNLNYAENKDSSLPTFSSEQGTILSKLPIEPSPWICSYIKLRTLFFVFILFCYTKLIIDVLSSAKYKS